MNILRTLNKVAFAIEFPFLLTFLVIAYVVDVLIGDRIVGVKKSAVSKYHAHMGCFKKHLSDL